LTNILSCPLLLTKFSMSMVYVNGILLVCTSNVRFAVGGDYSPYAADGKQSEARYIFAQVMSDTRGGLVSYVVGITFGICAFMALRMQLNSCHVDVDDIEDSDMGSETGGNAAENCNGSQTESQASVISPPPMAFRLTAIDEDPCIVRNYSGMSMDQSIEEDYGDLSQPLIPPEINQENPHASNESQNEDGQELVIESLEKTKPSRSDVILFETGLLAFLLFIPIFTQPLVKLKYSGILTPILDASVQQMTSLNLSDIIQALTIKSGKGIFPLITSTLLWINVVIVPTMNWILCSFAVLVMVFSHKHNASIQRVMRLPKLLQPLSHMTPFAVCVVVTVSALGQVSNYLFNDNYFCEFLSDLIGGDKDVMQCLEISGTVQPMLYLLFIQAAVTDYFIVSF